MPLYLSVPLPGPFRYSARVGGRRRRRKPLTWRTRHHSALYWLCGIWALEAEFWLLYGLVWLAVHLWALGVAYRRHRALAPSAGRREVLRAASADVPWSGRRVLR